MYGERYTEEEFAFAMDVTKQRLSEGLNQKEVAQHLYDAAWFSGRTIRSLEDLVTRCVKSIRQDASIDS